MKIGNDITYSKEEIKLFEKYIIPFMLRHGWYYDRSRFCHLSEHLYRLNGFRKYIIKIITIEKTYTIPIFVRRYLELHSFKEMTPLLIPSNRTIYEENERFKVYIAERIKNGIKEPNEIFLGLIETFPDARKKLTIKYFYELMNQIVGEK